MKVEQTRKVLVAAAAMHADLGDVDLASALNQLADILKPHDKIDLNALVARVNNLREAESAKSALRGLQGA